MLTNSVARGGLGHRLVCGVAGLVGLTVAAPLRGATFLSPHVNPIVVAGGRVYAANTPAGTVEVIDASTRRIVARIDVGVEPVGLAVRPDGRELWVANHVSDSVSVIDIAAGSPTRDLVVATVQDVDPRTRATQFDEPAGIAFADDHKAYVTLSAEDRVAVVDVASRRVVRSLAIPAQDPRAVAVRDGKLYVAAFESHNRTQLSGGTPPLDGDLETFDAWQHSVHTNNVLSLGAVVDIVKHPRVPDRDVFVFDARTDEPLATVSGVGTLLYGMAVDSRGRVFVTQTDARNDVNGRAGTRGHGLAELENRPFLNRITVVEPDPEAEPRFIDLEPLPPRQPERSAALATPLAVQVAPGDAMLVATAAGSDALFTVDVDSGRVLGRCGVAAWPDGVALEGAGDDGPLRAWVLSAFGAAVTLVDLADPARPAALATIPLDDPTPPLLRRGRIAFHSAAASSTGTFSCASCHPDGHTDQLLWVLATPVVSGGTQIMPRSTMPCRGLRDTAPFHWDGIPGDPYGGINSASIHVAVPPTAAADRPEAAPRHLVDGGLGSTMRLADDTTCNDEGKPGRLDAADRDALAAFLLEIPFPPAQRRPYDDRLSTAARDGFRLFHVDGDDDPSKPAPNVCGDCHRMPFLVSTNTPGTGMDAPTWRGAPDRWLILPQGRLNIVAFDFFAALAERGTPEREVWRLSWAGRPRFDPVWDMVLEAGTGFPGGFGRQVTLSPDTATDPATMALLGALEEAAAAGSLRLAGTGWLRDDAGGRVTLAYAAEGGAGRYREQGAGGRSFSRDDLIGLARSGGFIGTLTARLDTAAAGPQPALWTVGSLAEQRGRQRFPRLDTGGTAFSASGRHVADGAAVLVDGRRVAGEVTVDREAEMVTVRLASPPADGMHLVQLQNPGGLVSNELIVHVGAGGGAARSLGDVLRERGLDRIVGRWVDRGTRGTAISLHYAWRVPDRVLELHNTSGGDDSLSIITLDPRTGTMIQTGGDAKGETHRGSWSFPAGEDARLDLDIVSPEGRENRIGIRHRFRDADTLVITLEFAEPVVIELQRAD